MGLFWQCSVVVLASIVQSLGLTLQRVSYLEPPLAYIPESERRRQRSSTTPHITVSDETRAQSVETEGSESFVGQEETRKHSMMLWRAGIALFVSANIFGSTVQLAMLPLILVCTLQSAGLVANAVLAHFILKEPLTHRAFLGTVLVVVGAIIVAGLGGAQPDPETSLSQLFELLNTLKFRTWMLSTVFFSVVAGLTAGKFTANAAASAAATNPKIGARSGLIWGGLAGIASAHSLLMAKLSVGLLLQNFPNDLSYLLRPRFWVIAALFLVFALTQMWFVNRGLQCISTSVLYPLVFCVYNVVTIINSAMLYGRDAVFENGHVSWVVLGTVVLISGVLMLSSRFEDGKNRASPLPSWLPRRSDSRITIGTLASSSPQLESARLFSPVAPHPSSSHLQSPDLASPTLEETSSLLAGPTYTSFDTISPNITNPDKIRSRPGHRVLSQEQHKILRELGV